MADNFAPKDAPDGHRTVFVYDEAIYAQSDPGGTPGDVYITPGDIAKNTMYLYKLAVSVASDDLTIALTDLNDDDASATNPIRVKIGDVEHTLDAALSLTISAGDNTFNAGSDEFAGYAVGYFAYIRYNATDGVCIGAARFPTARKYSDFAENGDDETMDGEKGAVWNDITNAGANDVCCVIGYFECENAGAAGYEWSSVANVISEPIHNTSWLTWNPDIAPLAGAITSYTINVAKYILQGRKFEAHYDITVDDNGTGSTALLVDVPFLTVDMAGARGRNTTSGAFMMGSVGDASATIGVFTVAATYPVATGQTFRLIVTGEY